LSKLTWFKTGGNVKGYSYINNTEDLKEILLKIPNEIQIFVLGAGSNVLIRDNGFEGIVIKLGKEFNKIKIKDEKIYAGSGVLDSNLSKFALENSLKNLEFYSGIPGTLGGAIKMNAGCYGSETKNVIEGVKVLNRNAEEKLLKNFELGFDYRSSFISKDTIITEIIIPCNKGNKKDIKYKMEEIISKRENTQPLRAKTGGSTFKNPKGFFAAKLIEDSGCKGLQVGDAIVSEKHANFIINTNKASAKNIEDLGKKIIDRVYSKFNILLDWEIKIIGKS
tara:strand:- start:845 stop:1681 length:837 start_codon:yes stop_codon:yes gene_type:complete